MLRRFVFCALVLAGFGGAAAPLTPAYARGAPRHASMILDANTGAVLHNADGDELRHPASLTKMMTLYLTFETIESGRMKLSDKIEISDEAANAAPSNLDLKPGEEITVENAIRALITKSANDVAVALAEKIGGSEANFARLMNTRARDIGMSKTHFENASGLPDPDQVTTARDMITLGLRLQDDYPQFYPMFAMRAFSYAGSTHRNHNTLMNHFAGIDGIKTGYTRASGFNLVSSMRRGGRHLVGAVFGGDSAGSRNGEMRNLLTRAFNRAATVKTRKAPPSPLIAKLKAEPKLAQRPAPKPKPAPVKVAEAPPTPAPEPQPEAEPITAAVPPPAAPADIAPIEVEPPAAAATPLEVAKVKRITIAPRQGPPRPAPTPDETTDMAPEENAADDSVSVSVDPPSEQPTAPADPFAAAEVHDDPSRETIVPKIALAAPIAPLPLALDNSQRAMLGAADAVPPPTPAASAVMEPIQAAPVQPIAAAPRLKPVQNAQAPAPVQRGLPPSTLQAQAASLVPAAARDQHYAALQPSAGAGRYEIQIGAFGSIEDAQRALTNVQTRAGSLLAGAATVTHPAQSGGRQVFRARFSGFNSAGATKTCNELRRQAVDCFVMTSE